MLVQLKDAPHISLMILFVFGIDCFELARSTARGKQWTMEKGREQF
jgi:hypothetical protein